MISEVGLSLRTDYGSVLQLTSLNWLLSYVLPPTRICEIRLVCSKYNLFDGWLKAKLHLFRVIIVKMGRIENKLHNITSPVIWALV